MDHSLGTISGVETDMLVLVQSVQSVHLSLGELEVERIEIGDDPLFRVRLGQRDEPDRCQLTKPALVMPAGLTLAASSIG